MDSEPPSRPPLPPAAAGDAAPMATTAATASMRCSSAPASAWKVVGAESPSTSSLLARKPKVATGGSLADPASAASSQQQQQQQQPPQIIFCRICLDSDTEGLIAPCQCRGERERGAWQWKSSPHAPSLLAHLFSLFLVVSGLSLIRHLSHSLTLLLSTHRRHLPNNTKKQKKTGTQQYVHVACLRKWQSVAGKRDGDGEFFFFFSFIATA